MTARRVVDGVNLGELDLHYRLLNAPAYANIFAFDELWAESVALPALGGGSLRGLSPRHAFAHACLNRALDMQIGVPDRLKLLYDLHLMLGRLDDPAWQDLLALVARKGISGVCLRSIEDTVAALGTELSAGTCEALRGAAAREPLDRRRLHDWRYMQWRNLRALPGWAARVRWLWQRLLPTDGYLRAQYGEGSRLKLIAHRLRRGLARLCTRA